MKKRGRRTDVRREHEPPVEFVIQPRIVVSRETGQKMLRQARTAKSTPALRELMRDGD